MIYYGCNWTRTQNHLVLKRTLNHLAKLTFGQMVECCLRTNWFWVRVHLQSRNSVIIKVSLKKGYLLYFCCVLDTGFLQSWKISGKKENVRKVLEKQEKSGRFFHGLESFLFFTLTQGIFWFLGMSWSCSYLSLCETLKIVHEFWKVSSIAISC